MSDPSEFALSQSSSPKLPAIGENRNLVSQPLVDESRESVIFGEKEKKSVSQENNGEEVDANDEKANLINLICRAFINALQRNDEIKCWDHLCDALELSKPYSGILKTKQICHYAERAYSEIQEREELQFVSGCLQNFFSDVIVSLQNSGKALDKKTKFPSGPTEDLPLPPRIRTSVHKGIHIPRGGQPPSISSMYVFDKQQIETGPKKPQQQSRDLTLKDLKMSLADVTRELSARESVLGFPLGMAILAIDVNLPQTRVPTPPQTPKRQSSCTCIHVAEGQTKVPSDQKTKKEKVFVPRSGREIVESFIKGKFLGELRFAYLNFAPSKHYDPYNLIEVPKDKRNPDHFIISSHSILHVSSTGPSESQILSEWYAEASIFQAILNLTFFKNFLLRKMFTKWKELKKHTCFLKLKSEIEMSLLHNVPTFGSALIRISALLNDLSKVTFLPYEANHCFILEEFEEVTFKASETGQMYLNKFFNYCQLIVDKTEENCFEYLRYCEALVRNHRHNYKESLAIAKEKHNIRQKNLQLARDEITKLGNFVNLVDHIVFQNLLTVAQTNICKFVDTTLTGPRPGRNGLFQAFVVFDENHKLTLSPSTKQLSHSLSSALAIVLTSVCNLSHAMDLGEQTKSFIINASKVNLATNTPANEVDNLIDVHEKTDVMRNVRDYSPIPESQSFGYKDASESGSEIGLDYLVSPEHFNMKKEVAITPPEQLSDSTSHDIRTETEITEDIEDFKKRLEGTRGLKQIFEEPLCSKRKHEVVLLVEGQKVDQHGTSVSPLTREKLENTLYNDEKIKAALKYHEECVAESMEEVKEFCNNHNWLAEIHKFVSSWDLSQVEYWKGQPTSNIEQQLHQIQTWTEQVSHVISKFSTANGLLYVDCCVVQNKVLPKLNNIFKQMVKMVASQVLFLSKEVITDMERLSESLKDQTVEIRGYAEFILQLAKVKSKIPDLKEKVEHIKNLFEVIRSCYRQLSEEEEITEEKVWVLWESFLFGLQEASDFVQLQKPLIIEKIAALITNLEKEAFNIGREATNGRFLDPKENPTSILMAMRKLRDRYLKIRTRLKDISKWKEIITGSSYDLTSVLEIYDSMDKRQELWRYCEVSSNTIKDWLNSPFKKVNIKRAMDRVNEWIMAGNNMKAHIDPEDEVLSSWMTQLKEFIQDLPLLLQLSSDALKPRHWKALYIGIGQEFDSSMLFTMASLFSFNLGRYKDLISAICAGAYKEHALELLLNQLSKAWWEREFKLAKHIPLMRSRFGAGGKTSNTDGQKKKKRNFALDKAANIISKPRTPAFAHDSFTLIGIGELKCIIEDNLITLKSMLVSPYVADLKPSVEYWITCLYKIEGIVDKWSECQRKWLYLSNVFSEPNILVEFSDHLNDFTRIDTKYREFIQVISKDCKVVSVIHKNRNEQGWRELRGQTLEAYLLELVQEEEELIKVVDVYMQQARNAFPRLYFLSDNALLSLLAWSRNPRDLLPFVKMCFPGIKSLHFALPRDSSIQLTTALDVALNVHLMEVTEIEGLHGERVSLVKPIPASPRPQKWLANLEQNMRDTLAKELGDCVGGLLDSRMTNISRLIERIVKQESCCMAAASIEAASVQDHWFVRFPAQCILTAHAASWARQVSQILGSGRLLGLSNIRSEVLSSIDDLSSAIRKNIEWHSESPLGKRFEAILSALLTQAVNHRDVVNGLIGDRVSSLHSFEWQSEIKPEIEITEVISSLYDGSQAIDNVIPVQRSYEVGRCTVQQLGSSSAYGYEYIGPSSRLVTTPLTKRCFLSLNMALQAFNCGTLHGPDGMGKTETIRDLSKILGRHMIMFDCSHNLASPLLVRYLSGMVCAGSWVCFENIDSVKPGVLSVFGQHLEKIRGSMKALKRNFHSQYTVRRSSSKDKNSADSSERRSSVASLIPLYGNQSVWLKPYIEKELQSQRRRLSVTESSNISESSYYKPLDKPTKKIPPTDQILEVTYQDINGCVCYKDATPMTFTVPLLGNVVFNNQLMAASEMYGCFMTMSSYYNSSANIPENLKALLRPVAMVLPDILPVLEVSLTCCGFTEAKPLANKILTFFKMISDQVFQALHDFSLRSMRSVIILASKQLGENLKKKALNKVSDGESNKEASTRSPFLESFERRQTEENSVVLGIFIFFGNKLQADDRQIFSATLDSVFVHSVLMPMSTEGDPVLQNKLKEYFQENGFQLRPEMISKALDLYKGIRANGQVIVLGSAGSGKTTLYQALAGAVNNINSRLSANIPPRKTTKATNMPTETTVNMKSSSTWPKLDVMVVYPKSMTNHELFGQMDSTTNLWRDGLISKYFRDTNMSLHTKNELQSLTSEEKQRVIRGMSDVSHVEKWLVFDGPMDDLWMGHMNSVLDYTRALSLENGGAIIVPDTVFVLFETSDLTRASPSLVTRCSIVHCSDTLIGWKSCFRSWIKNANAKWDISSRGLGIISTLMDHVVDATLEFLQSNCKSVLNSHCGTKTTPATPSKGIHEVQTLIRYLSALFDRHILRNAEDHRIQAIQHKGSISIAGSTGSRHSSGLSSTDSGKVISAFAFAFVWSFGGHIHERYKKAFDEHARKILSSGPYPATIPEEGLVYDYYLDFLKGMLIKWEDRPGAQFKTLASSFTVVPELDRYFFLMDLMISAHKPVLLVGNTGSGKSALIQNLISPRYSYQRIFMSPGLSSNLLQETIESKVSQLKRRDLMHAPNHQKISDNGMASFTKSQLFFLDDLNYARADETCDQPPLELLRQIIGQGYLYDKESHHYHPVKNIQFLATAVPSSSTSVGSGITSHVLSARLARLMTVLSFFPVSSDTLTVIYTGVYQGWLQEFPAYSLTHHSLIAKAMASAAVKLFDKIREELRPSPLNPHFIFTQHDLARVAQCMSLFSTSSRSRPRPRIRRRGGDKGMSVYSSKTDIIGELGGNKSDILVKESMKTEQGSSKLDVEVKKSVFKTPAVLSPLMRSLFRLWCHENTRTYYDRLLDEDQRFWFASLLKEHVEEFFCKGEGSFDLIRLDQSDSQTTIEDQSEDLFGVAPGSNAPPPSAKANTPLGKSIEEPKEKEADQVEKFGTDKDAVDDGNGDKDDEAVDEEDAEEDYDIEGEEETNEDSTQSEEDKDQQEEESDIEDSEEKLDAQDEDVQSENSTSISSGTSAADSAQAEKIECTFGSIGPCSKVTFGDLKELEDKDYKGPLITFDQFTQPGEDVTDIVFNKHFNASVQLMGCAPDSAGRSYVECTSDVIERGVQHFLVSYNSRISETNPLKKINFVAFRQALQHAARISRALSIQGGHALLLSCLGYGRRTLVRLASYAAGYKLMELQTAQFQSNDEQRQQIKAASYMAGLQGKPTVLFVPEDQTDNTLQDICTLIAEGTCPGLYNSEEMSIISKQLLPGGQRGARRTEHQDIAQERFFRRVKSKLHVIVCLKYVPLSPRNSPSTSQLYKFPFLFTRCCCVDAYLPWPHEALTSIAEKLIDEEDPVFTLVPWKDRRERGAKVASICSIMAHVHLSARSMVQKMYGTKGLKVYSPDDYLDFVDLFKKICVRLCLKEKATISRLKHGLERMEEAHSSIEEIKNELSELTPQCNEGQDEVRQSQQSIEATQKGYQEQKEASRKQELEVEKINAPVEVLKRESLAEFGKVSPLFDSALKAINALDVHDVEEIRSYRVPPHLVELVANSICLLFKKSQNWEQSKKLFNQDNFFRDLEFYNIKGMSDSMFNKLEEFCDNKLFKPEIVRDGSVAASSLCMWVRAVYDYSVVYRALKPKRKLIHAAEKELKKAKTKLGEMRVHCNTIKHELEEKIEAYKETVKRTKIIEKKIQAIESRKLRATNLVSSLNDYYDSWKATLGVSQQHLATSPGDALIAAACVCYFGPLSQRARQDLFYDWLKVCDGTTREIPTKASSLAMMMLRDPQLPRRLETDAVQDNNQEAKAETSNILKQVSLTNVINKVALRKGLSLASILTENDELTEWMKEGLPNDEQAVQNVLIMHTCSEDRTCWPLLIDPYGQAEKWLRALMEVKAKSTTNPTTSNTSRRRSSPTRVPSSLDYQDLDTQDDDDDHTSNKESIDGDDVILPELGNCKDEEAILRGSDSPVTAITDQTSGTAFTSMAEKTYNATLAREMDVPVDSPDVSTLYAPTPHLDIDERQIMVIPADDPQLRSKIRAAAIAGVLVLVTHMERRRWNKKLWLLLSRQILFDSNTNRKKIIIGKSAVEFRPSFRLFFSSSVPLFMLGEGLVPLPLSKTCVIDMSLSQEGITDCLLTETLALERPEYEGQKRSLERDLTLHEQQMINAQEYVLDKVLELKQPLLKDTTMLANVNKSRDVVSTAGERYQESLTMRNQMQAKRDDFLPVAHHGAMLYTIICQMHKIRPAYYYMPFETYLKLFRETIAERKRNKKNLGSPAARAAELVSALSRMIYTRMSWGLFLGDNLVFSFLMSIEKLLSENQITEDELQLFIYHQHTPEHWLPVVTDQDKPDWITPQAWRSLDQLERLPPFKNLRRSLIEFPEEWREYYLLPPVLLAQTPGDFSFLTIFQKALLWRVFQEDQMFQVCQDFVLCVMGATMIHPVEYDMTQVYLHGNNSTPVVLMLPSHEALSDGTSAIIRDPMDDILDLARRHGKAMSLVTVCLGEITAMEHAINAVQRGMDSGHWVVIKNAHLADYWSQEFLDTLQVITSTPQTIEEQEHENEAEWNEDYESRTTQSINQTLVHPEFRLFLTVRVDSGKPLPAILIQHGLKLACESKVNFRSTMKQVLQLQAYSINSWSCHWKESVFKTNTFKTSVPQYAMYALAYFHSLMLSRRQYGSFAFTCPYQWSYQDVRGAVDMLRHLTHACIDQPLNTANKHLLNVALVNILAGAIYNGHVIHAHDEETVKSIAKFVCESKALEDIGDFPDDTPVDDVLKQFPKSPSLEQLGLVKDSTTRSCIQFSRTVSVAFKASLDHIAPRFDMDKVMLKVLETSQVVDECLATIKEPEQDNYESALQAFFARELDYYKEALILISKDLQLLIKAIEGSVACTSYLHSLMGTIYRERVPPHWHQKCPGSLSLGLWLKCLSSGVRSVQLYTSSPPSVIHLSAIVHRQTFFSCVKRDYCRTNSKAPQSLVFNLEVMHPSFKPESPPEHGVFLLDFTIKNALWDLEKRHLTDNPRLSAVNQLPVVLLTFLDSKQSRDSRGSENLIVYNCSLITEDKATNPLQNISLPILSAISYEDLVKRNVCLSISFHNF